MTVSSQFLTVVIRTTGERTFEACLQLLLAQVPSHIVKVINERPFEKALRRTYKAGISRGAKWTMTLDADVLLRAGAVDEFLNEAEAMPEHFFQVEGRVQDKLTGLCREAGHRLYRTKYLPLAIDRIPEAGTAIRPEYATLVEMERIGFPSRKAPLIVGIHDYEQYYRDIYRKAFVHANKHQIWLHQIASRCKRLATTDDDFRMALRGINDGLMTFSDVRIDARDQIEASQEALADLGLEEKPALPANELNFAQIDKVIATAREKSGNSKNQGLEVKLQRLRNRYSRLGLLRIAPHIFGSLLCDIGTVIRKMAEKGR